MVPDKIDRLANFHQQTRETLKELVQAAGLSHAKQISATHVVRRTSDHEVRLLANMLTTVAPGALLAAERGEADWPHKVFSLYWPLARSVSFRAAALANTATTQAQASTPRADPAQPPAPRDAKPRQIAKNGSVKNITDSGS